MRAVSPASQPAVTALLGGQRRSSSLVGAARRSSPTPTPARSRLIATTGTERHPQFPDAADAGAKPACRMSRSSSGTASWRPPGMPGERRRRGCARKSHEMLKDPAGDPADAARSAARRRDPRRVRSLRTSAVTRENGRRLEALLGRPASF